MPTLLADYINGSYRVQLFSDGTKIKESQTGAFVADFPDSIDLKITDYCDLACPMCHENSTATGRHANLQAEFLNALPKGVELAIGGGNPLAHPDLADFLQRMKEQGIICNLTVNERHLWSDYPKIERLLKEGLICGLGVSARGYSKNTAAFLKAYPNAVLHVIAGIFTDFSQFFDSGVKILILGYKKFGRGEAYFSPEIQRNLAATQAWLPSLLKHFKCVSFDNLAIRQLSVQSVFGDRVFDRFFMGEDGSASMYIDLVGGSFAKSSVSTVRYPIEKSVCTMFSKIKP